MKIVKGKGLSFDDVLLIPQYSEVRSRKDVDLSVEFGSMKFQIPIMSSNMDTVTEVAMARAMNSAGGVGVLHRNMPLEHRFMYPYAGVAFGVNEDLDFVISEAKDREAKLLVLDIAHGDSKHALEAISKVRAGIDDDDLILVGGNVASPEAVTRMADAGATAVKVGIGPGSACTTRIATGTGIPQLTAISECASAASSVGLQTIADGGIKTAGDVAKAIAAGADMVMLGGMLAGTNEAPGDIIAYQGKSYKEYRGMASKEAGSAYAEGISGLVPARGPVRLVLEEICNGLASACSYSGASNLMEFRENATFIESQHASTVVRESAPHDIIT